MMFTRQILEENGIFASFFLSTDKVPELCPHGNYSYLLEIFEIFNLLQCL